MRYWAFVLHFYQPPTQALGATEYVVKTCYLPVLKLLLAHPQAKVTINIQGSLIRQLQALADTECLSLLQQLVQREQVVLLTSPMYHALIPLTPQDAILRQIDKSTRVLTKLFGNEAIVGLYPPELAIDRHTVALCAPLVPLVIVDQSSITYMLTEQSIPAKSVYLYGNTLLLAASRSITEIIRSYPTELNAQAFLQFVEQSTQNDQVVVSVNDAEIFGHHYAERIHFLKELFTSPTIRFIHVSEVTNYEQPTKIKANAIRESSWQTSQYERDHQQPYPLWRSPKNHLQTQYAALAELAYKGLKKSQDTDLLKIAQKHYDQGISSCHTYWLSNWPWWHPDLAEAGATHLIRAIRTLPLPNRFKNRAEQVYHELTQEIWRKHWSGEVEKTYTRYNKHREQFLKSLPTLEGSS